MTALALESWQFIMHLLAHSALAYIESSCVKIYIFRQKKLRHQKGVIIFTGRHDDVIQPCASFEGMF